MTDTFKVLNDVEHVLLRPEMYISSVTEETQCHFIKGEFKELKIVPGLLTICRELYDNSISEHIRSNKEYATKIDIKMDAFSFEVSDNGRGIPCTKKFINNGVEEYQPVLAWCKLRSGTSFVEDRISPSVNGVGASLSNIFSLYFCGETFDGTSCCRVECYDNLSKTKVAQSKRKHATGTTVRIEPDFSRFGLKGFTKDYVDLFRERICDCASIYPTISFTFNGEKIRFKKAKEYLSTYGNKFVSYEDENFFIGIFPSITDDYMQKSTINAISLSGGTHEQFIARDIASALKELIKKKYKIDMTIPEIKRGLFLIVNASQFLNMRFEAQTKDKLKNPESEIFHFFHDIPFTKLAKNILDIPEIIEPIIESKLLKQQLEDEKAVKKVQKSLSNTKIKKYVHANARNRERCTLFLCEGDSAAGSLINVRDTNFQGCFPLRGMPLNVYGLTDKKILENQEFASVMAILGLNFQFSDKEVLNNLQYGRIAIFTDADIDGLGGILPLMINFFKRWKVLFDKKKIVYVESPLWIAKKGSDVRMYYHQEDFDKEKNKLKDYKCKYLKGLGSLTESEYKMVINSEEHFIPISIDDETCFEVMFSNDSDKRKDLMKE